MFRRWSIALLSGLAALVTGCVDNRDERLAAVVELGRDGDPASVGRVEAFVDDPDGDVRAFALVTLSHIATDEAAAAAVRSLSDPEAPVRLVAVTVVAATRPSGAVELLAARLTDDADPAVRARAAEHLGDYDDERARAAIDSALQDEDARVRHAAVASLARVGVDEAIDTLAALLSVDENWEVRAEAAKALGRATRSRVWTVLDGAREDPNEFVRASAQLAQGDLRRAAVPRPPAGAPGSQDRIAKPAGPGV